MRRQASGFTLVEVLIAVAVLAIAMSAVISTMARQASNASYLREKTIAIWVAHNRLVEIQLQTEWPDTGKSDGEMQMADQDWRWETEVEKTPEEELRRVEVRVYHPDDETRASMAQLSAFIGRLSAAR
ncbi:MAG: type II secretion system minor pseudopilin GspI [Panacagrimonas sp.]